MAVYTFGEILEKKERERERALQIIVDLDPLQGVNDSVVLIL